MNRSRLPKTEVSIRRAGLALSRDKKVIRKLFTVRLTVLHVLGNHQFDSEDPDSAPHRLLTRLYSQDKEFRVLQQKKTRVHRQEIVDQQRVDRWLETTLCQIWALSRQPTVDNNINLFRDQPLMTKTRANQRLIFPTGSLRRRMPKQRVYTT